MSVYMRSTSFSGYHLNVLIISYIKILLLYFTRCRFDISMIPVRWIPHTLSILAI